MDCHLQRDGWLSYMSWIYFCISAELYDRRTVPEHQLRALKKVRCRPISTTAVLPSRSHTDIRHRCGGNPEEISRQQPGAANTGRPFKRCVFLPR